MSASIHRLEFLTRVVLWTLPSWQMEDKGFEFDLPTMKHICPQMHVLMNVRKKEELNPKISYF